MKERPILFSAPMVRAILEGRKTQTRRVVGGRWKVEAEEGGGFPFRVHAAKCRTASCDFRHTNDPRDDESLECGGHELFFNSKAQRSPFGAPGERLWVRETWQAWSQTNIEYDEWEPIAPDVRMVSWAEWVEQNGKPDAIEYRADGPSKGPWTPSIHMPRWASRIDLEVTGVRVERLCAMDGCDWGDGEGSEFWLTEGNFACDCNRHLTFVRASGEEPPDEELQCSDGKYRITNVVLADGTNIKIQGYPQ